MNRNKTLVLAATAAIAFAFGFAAKLTAAERFDHLVRADLFAGFAGNQEALERGMKKCEEILATEPKHPAALVWHGSGLFYQAGQAFRKGDMETGGQLMQRGTGEMDEAVALAPDSIGVRIPRGGVYLSASRTMPPQMGQPLAEKAVTDYETAYKVQKDNLAALGMHPRGELLLGLADGYSRTGRPEQAQAMFEKVVKEVPESEYARRAALWLETRQPLPANKATCIGCHSGK